MPTTLFSRTLLKGMTDGMVDAGFIHPFATDKLANDVFDKIASAAELPVILEQPLSNDQYIKLGQWIMETSQEAVNRGYAPSASIQALAKQASHVPLEERAMKIAAFMMAKVAEEASLNGTGTNTPESAASTSSVAHLDQKNRSSLQYLVGVGNTDMPEAGVVGRQMPHPMGPKGPAIHNSLEHLDKQANEKIARAATFVAGLAQRDAEVTPKLVLASAALAEGGTPGLEIMAHIVQNVKTAEELDGMLDHVMGAQEAHGAEPDPALIAAIEHVLMEHGLLGHEGHEGMPEGHEGLPESEEEAEEEAAGPMNVPTSTDPKMAAMKDIAKSIKDVASKSKGKAKNIYESVKGQAHSATSKVKDKSKSIYESAKSQANKATDKAKNVGKTVATAAKKHGPAAAGGLALGGTVARVHYGLKDKDESEKEAALLSVLKAAADGALNEGGENTPEAAAKDNNNAALDLKNRKPEEYLEGAGKTEMPNVGYIGELLDVAKGPKKLNPDTTPAREAKGASYNEAVKSAATQWGPKLPATMAQSEKRAHVIAIAGMPEDLRADYVAQLLSA